MKALVAMSGGVDSSVAAALMLDQGYEVIGVTLKQWEGEDGQMPLAGCCTVSDAEDARRVAAQLDVPYYVLDYVDEFTEKVVDHFGEMYAAGLTSGHVWNIADPGHFEWFEDPAQYAEQPGRQSPESVTRD